MKIGVYVAKKTLKIVPLLRQLCLEVDYEPEYDCKTVALASAHSFRPRTDPSQVDTDFLLPTAMKQYLVDASVGSEQLVLF